MKKIALVLLLAMIVILAGCHPTLFGLGAKELPQNPATPAGQQPSPSSVSSPTDVHMAWEKFALVGVVCVVLIVLCQWKAPFLVTPIVYVATGSGLVILLRVFIKDILMLCIASAAIAFGYLAIRFGWAWFKKSKLFDTVTQGVANAGPASEPVKAEIKAVAIESGTLDALNATLVSKGLK